jgi:hypothetical protein
MSHLVGSQTSNGFLVLVSFRSAKLKKAERRWLEEAARNGWQAARLELTDRGY